ncbi:hypothetical protein QBC44DRAFT_322055 [Cladorrhinum sp. PSN332]|nr:hypothetical protein QBC44DRAFT_322055 [Cladorrhinum sp. PSN332]
MICFLLMMMPILGHLGQTYASSHITPAKRPCQSWGNGTMTRDGDRLGLERFSVGREVWSGPAAKGPVASLSKDSSQLVRGRFPRPLRRPISAFGHDAPGCAHIVLSVQPMCIQSLRENL